MTEPGYRWLPARRPDVRETVSLRQALGRILTTIVIAMLILPWLVRLFNWLDLGGMYDRYAKWACQC